LGSCQRNIRDIKAKFEISNMTDQSIDSINIKPFDHESNSNFIHLVPGESQVYSLEMTELPKVDGDYLLTFKRIRITNRLRDSDTLQTVIHLKK
jgi:hypothetical protein